jgi:hypothetical protein
MRDSRPPLDTMDRAARQLEDLFAIEVLPLEEHISRAVRMHIPTVIEDVGSLPDRLRLLHLPGMDRAQQLLQMSTDLLKEDASGAAMILGASDCPLASDIGWAKAVLKALVGDGEQLIRNAQRLAASVSDLEELFPDEAGELITDANRETIQAIHSSDNFFERILDLRMALRTISDKVSQRYAEIKQPYEEKQLPEARNELENTARWLDLTPEDRQDIGGRLTVSGVPDTPRPQRELADLRLLLTRRMGLAALVDTLKHEVDQRAPQDQAEPEEPATGVTPSVIRITARDLVPPSPIKTEEDLNAWLTHLREQLQVLLSEYSEIRFE